MKRCPLIVVTFALGAFLAGAAAPAHADPAPTVTLTVSPRTVDYGKPVRFTGQVSPPSAGQVVDVVDGRGETVAEATTGPDGTYRMSSTPQRNLAVHAQWGTAASGTRLVRVRPRLIARRGAIHLFDTTKVTGRLSPPHGGSHIDVTLWRNGQPIQRATPMLTRHGTFAAQLEVQRAGRFSVVVRFHSGDSAGVSWRSKPAVTHLPPPLHVGSYGPYVRLLERRLAELHYRVYGQDPSFDYRDGDAVLAFHKVQGMERTTSVDLATWRALASPKIPQPRDHSEARHFEVDLTKQVVYYVEEGQITGILHVSSGKPSTPTRPGTFHVWSKQPGTNRDGMYNSSFFDGNRALHGYPDVPAYAASHGCVRIPFWNALWVYDRAPIGIEVLVHY